MRYQPKDYSVRAVLWRGDMADLPDEWLMSGQLTREDDGVLICRTKHGPSPATPNGNWYITELPDGTEFYPVLREVFEAKYELVGEQ